MNSGKGRGKYSHHPCHRLSVPSANLFWCRHCMQIFEDPIARWRHSRTCKDDSSQKHHQDTHDIKNLFVGTHHILFPQKEKTQKRPLSVCVAPGKNPAEDLSCFICSKKFCSLEEMRNHVKFPCYKLPWKAQKYSDRFLDDTDTSLSDDVMVERVHSQLHMTVNDNKDSAITTTQSTLIEQDGLYTVSVNNSGSVIVSRDDDFETDIKPDVSTLATTPPVSETSENIENDGTFFRDKKGRYLKNRKSVDDLSISEKDMNDAKLVSNLSKSKNNENVEQIKVPLKKRKCIYCAVEFTTEQALIKHNRYPCLLRQTRNLSQRVLRSKSKSTLLNTPPSKKKSPTKKINRSTSISSSIPRLKTPHLVLTKKGKKLLKEKRKLLIELKSRTIEKHKKIPCPSMLVDGLEEKEKFFYSLGMLYTNRLPPDFKSFDRQEEEKELDELLNKYSSVGVLKPVSVEINSAAIPTVVDRTETDDDDCFPSPPILERIDVLKQSGIATEYSDDDNDEDPPDLDLAPGVQVDGSNQQQILRTLWEDLGLKSEQKYEDTTVPAFVSDSGNDSEMKSEEICSAKKQKFSIISPLRNKHTNEANPLKDLKERHFTDLFLYGLGAFAYDIDKNFENAAEKEALESDESRDKLDRYGLKYIEKAIENVNNESVFEHCHHRSKERVKLPNLNEQFEKPSNFMEWRKSLFESFSEWCHAAKSCNKPLCDSRDEESFIDNESSISKTPVAEDMTYAVTSSTGDNIFTDTPTITDDGVSYHVTLAENSDTETTRTSTHYQNYEPLIPNTSQAHNVGISSSNCFTNTADIQSVRTDILSNQEDVVVSTSSPEDLSTDSELPQVPTIEESNLLLHCVDEVVDDCDDATEEMTYIIVKNKLIDSDLVTNPLYEDRLTLHASEGECAAQQNLLAQLANSKHREERPVYHYVFQNNSGAEESIDAKQMANIILSHKLTDN